MPTDPSDPHVTLVQLSHDITCKSFDPSHRHEMPTDPSDPLSKQNMKDRYYGTNDTVADKMLKQVTLPMCVP